MHYDFISPQRIVFGSGRRNELASIAKGLGNRVFLVSGSRSLEKQGLIDQIEVSLLSASLTVQRFSAPSREPGVSDVDLLVSEWRKLTPTSLDTVIAVGGGSTIDLAKAGCALATNRHGSSVTDFLEGVGKGLTITVPPISMIALPTTSGTGAEVTKNAVISSYEPTFKKSLRSDLMVPRVVLIDPELTVTLPATVTAYTGMDAITQLIESYISRKSAPIPRALVPAALRDALRSLPIVVRDGSSLKDREIMSHAALLSGLALANSGLGFAHGVAAALGVYCRIPHGLACAMMLPSALRLNRSASERELAELEYLISGAHSPLSNAAESFISRIEQLCIEIGIPNRLRDVGVTSDQLPNLVKGSRGNSMNGNPRELRDDEILTELSRIW